MAIRSRVVFSGGKEGDMVVAGPEKSGLGRCSGPPPARGPSSPSTRTPLGVAPDVCNVSCGTCLRSVWSSGGVGEGDPVQAGRCFRPPRAGAPAQARRAWAPARSLPLKKKHKSGRLEE